MHMLTTARHEDYWQYFVNHYEFVDSSISSLLVKMSIKAQGIPTNPTLLARIKDLLANSQHLVYFLSNE